MPDPPPPPSPKSARGRKRTNGQLNGHVNGDGDAIENGAPGPDMDPAPPPKKTKRGRPRVECEPEESADKRRVQIRMAQRAYRQRKEDTIHHLGAREAALIAIINKMTASLDRLDNNVVHSNMSSLDPGMAALFKKEFAEMRSAADPSLVSPPKKDDEQATGGADTDGRRLSKKVPQRPLLPKDPAQPGPQSQGSNEIFHTYMPWGYENPSNSNSSVAKPRITVGEVLGAPSQATQQLPFGLIEVDNQLQVARRSSSPIDPPYEFHDFDDLHSPMSPPTFLIPQDQFQNGPFPMNTSPTPFTTYSFTEPTFARRLSRAALESGYRLLHNASVQPSLLNYVFKLSLPWLTIDKLKEKFHEMLARNQDEELDWWEAPFIHLGGAGLHYPRRDANGTLIPIQHTYTTRKIGPVHLNQMRLEGMTWDGKTHHVDMDLESFQGKWFDAHDVEGYLQDEYNFQLESKDWAQISIENGNDLARGIQPQPSSLSSLPLASYRGISTSTGRRGSNDSLYVPSLSDSSRNSSPYIPDRRVVLRERNGDREPNRQALVPRAHASIQTTQPRNRRLIPNKEWDRGWELMNRHMGLDCCTGNDLGYAKDPNWNGTRDLTWLGSKSGKESLELPAIKQSEKTRHRLHLETLIKEIIPYAVCLGRAPGYRKKDIDMAVRKCVSLDSLI